MASREEYYGSEQIDSLSFLEFGSIDIKSKKRTTWAYWQDQEAYDLYMFSRYARDLFAFRQFIEQGEHTIERLNTCIANSAHDKLLDYIFKYVGMISILNSDFLGGCATNKPVCESGSSLYGLIEETIAVDAVFNGGKSIESIKSLSYLCSDISDFMNKGAMSFHPEIEMKTSNQPTIANLFSKDVEELSLFYGLGVSLRYALRNAEDIILAASKSELVVFNRISLTRKYETEQLIYGTGKCEYIISLPLLCRMLDDKGYICRYCSENIQYEKDGKDTLRVCLIISKSENLINEYERKFVEVVEACDGYVNCENVVWRGLGELL